MMGNRNRANQDYILKRRTNHLILLALHLIPKCVISLHV